MLNKSQFNDYLNDKMISTRRKKQILSEIDLLDKFLGNQKIIPAKILDYKDYLIKNFKPSTCCYKFGCINNYLDFLNIPKISYVFRCPDKKDLLSLTEYKRLLKSCATLNEKALLRTFFYTGIRIDELNQLNFADLEAKKFKIYKKNTLRSVPVHDNLYNDLIKYCAENKIISGTIFLNKKKLPLTKAAITKIFKSLARKAKIKMAKVTRTHNFRRLFIINSANNGIPIIFISKIVGHKSVSTTLEYTNKENEILVDDFNKKYKE